MGIEKIYKRLENTGSVILGEIQKEILYLLCEEYLTPQQIANKRNTSLNAVYLIIKKLKNKGIIKGVSQGALIKGGSSKRISDIDKVYRLHAQSFIIDILDNSSFFKKILTKRNRDELDNNTIMLYEDKLLIYYNKDFWGNNVNESVRLSLDYTERFLVMLENNYKITLKKGRQCNLREFKGEIAKTGDVFAKEINLSKQKLKVYDEDGTLRLIVDNSFNYDELETVSEHYLDDMKSINDKWMDLIKTDLKLSEVEEHLKAFQEINKKMSERFEQMLEIQNTNAIMLLKLTEKVNDK